MMTSQRLDCPCGQGTGYFFAEYRASVVRQVLGPMLAQYGYHIRIFMIYEQWPTRISLSYAKDRRNTRTQRPTGEHMHTCVVHAHKV